MKKTHYQFSIDRDPKIHFPYGTQKSVASMSRQRKARSFFFLTFIFKEERYRDSKLVGNLIGQALPCLRYMIAISEEKPTVPGKVVCHILLEVYPALFQIDVWLSIEKFFLEKKETVSVNLVPLTTFTKACQFMLDVSVNEPFCFNFSIERAHELLRLSRLKRPMTHVNCPLDPKVVTEGTFCQIHQIEYRRYLYPPAAGVVENEDKALAEESKEK